jgi:hypothetical protein
LNDAKKVRVQMLSRLQMPCRASWEATKRRVEVMQALQIRRGSVPHDFTATTRLEEKSRDGYGWLVPAAPDLRSATAAASAAKEPETNLSPRMPLAA